jgi:uncharacterized membrane protein
MEFLKAFAPLANWIMRLALIGFLTTNATNEFIGLELNTLHFWLAMLGALMGALLLMGGMTGNNSWTRLAGFFLSVLMVYFIYTSWWAGTTFWYQLMSFGIALNFAGNGNKS